MSRWLARLMALMVLIPTGLLGGSPRPAHAQRSAVTVYLLDFNNKTELGGPLLGRQAAAQVAVEINESQGNNFTVVPDRQVQNVIRDLGIRPPFDKIARQQIARAVDADAVIYGNVVDAAVNKDPLQATVTLQVFAEDTRTGTLFNGAIAHGASVPRMGYAGDADILIDEALNKAAYTARVTMDRLKTPEGTVLNTAVAGGSRDTYALVNIGSRQGAKRGEEMVVTRRRDLVGIMKLVRVDANDSTGEVILNIQGVRPEDRVRGIFSFEDLPKSLDEVRDRHDRASSEGPSTQHVAKKPARPAVLSLKGGGTFEPMVAKVDGPDETQVSTAAAAGAKQRESEEGKGEKTTEPTGTGSAYDANTVTVDQPRFHHNRKRGIITPATASILAGGALLFGILAIGGTKGETRAFAVRATTFQPDGVGTGETGIRVQWKRPRGIQGDLGSTTLFKPGIIGYVVYRTDVTGGAITQAVGGVLGDQRIFLDASFTVHGIPNVIPAGQPGTTAAAATVDNAIPTGLAAVPGLIPGHRYRYQIQAVYHTEQDLDGDGINDPTDVYGPLSPFSNPTTALVPAQILAPAQGDTVDLRNLVVTFQTTPGADRYQVLISKNLNFRGPGVVRCPIRQIVPPDRGGPAQVSVPCSIQPSTRNVGAGNRTFITVLAFAADDPFRPVPFGGVTYPPIQVTQTGPPPPPPGATHAPATVGAHHKK